MSSSKVEMSLDDIIKANKGNGKFQKRGAKGVVNTKVTGKRFPKAILKRRPGQKDVTRGNTSITKSPRRGNRIQKASSSGVVKSRANFKRAVGAKPNKTVSVATKNLVQKLVKKALAQSNVRNKIGKPVVRNTLRRRLVSKVGKAVVLNRISKKSRVITRRPRIIQTVTEVPIRQRRQQIMYQPVQTVASIPRQNFSPVQRRRIVRPVVIQQSAPMYQFAGGFQGRGNVRDQIFAMRRQVVPRPVMRARPIVQQPQFAYVQQPQRPRVQQQHFVYVQRQQQRTRHQSNNFQQRGRQQRSYNPLYEPPNFLQRI